MEINTRLNFGLSASEKKEKAIALLAKCKEREAKRKLVSVRIDKNTIRLMSPEKAEKFFKAKEL